MLPCHAALCVSVFAVLTAGCGGSPNGASGLGLSCGTYRWSVKTLSDPDATTVNLNTPIPTTIAALNGLSRRCDRVDDRRVFAEELQVYEVTGTIVTAKLEDDRDHHIILTDGGQTIITELPDAACVGAVSSPYLAALVQAHTQFLALFPLAGQTSRRSADCA